MGSSLQFEHSGEPGHVLSGELPFSGGDILPQFDVVLPLFHYATLQSELPRLCIPASGLWTS